MTSKKSTAFNWVSVVVLPGAIALSSYWVSSSIERSKVSSEYVKLAVSILATKKSSDSDEQRKQRALRNWAVRVLNENSPVSLNQNEIEAFTDGNLKIDFSSLFSPSIQDAMKLQNGASVLGIEDKAESKTLPLDRNVKSLELMLKKSKNINE